MTIEGGKLRINDEASLGGDPAAFNAGQLTLNGGTLQAFGSFSIDDANRGVTLGVSGSAFEVDATRTLTVANVITGAGGLTKTGNGTLVLSGGNNYAGQTVVSAGVLTTQNASALGGAGSGATVASGATLRLEGGITVGTGGLSLGGTGFTGQPGALVHVSGTSTLGGQLTLTANTTIASLAGDLDLTSTATVIGGARTLTLTGAGNGSLAGALDTTITGLTKSGAGNWTLNGANTYTAATTISGGTFTVGSTGTLGTTAVTVQNTATYNVLGTTGAGAVTVQTGGTLAGSGTVGGAVTISNDATLSPGDALTPGSTATLSISGALNLANDTRLAFTLGTSSDQVTVGGNLLLNGVLTLAQGAGFGSSASYTLLTYAGTLTNVNLVLANPLAGYNYTISTATAGQVNLLVSQTGLRFWDGAGTTANGTVDGGAGVWTNAAGNTNWTDGTGSANGAWTAGQTAVFTGTAGNVQVDETVVVGGLQFASGYTLEDAGGGVGKISVSAAATEVRVDPSVEATVAVPIIGAGGLNKTGTGTLTLSAPGTYAGATLVTSGTLKLEVANALPTGTALTVGSDGQAANLDASGASQSVSSLHVASNSGSTSTVTIGAGQTLSVTGTGGFRVGVVNSAKARTNAVFTGGGALVVNNTAANFEAGIQTATGAVPGADTGADSASNQNVTTVDMTGLSSVSVNVNFFRVGYGLNNGTTLSLSNTANYLTANAVQISDSNGWNAQAATMVLGTGINVIETDSITIGVSKGNGTLKFQSQTAGSAGTVEIRGKSGATTNITVGANNGTNTGAVPTGVLDLRGHAATVNAGNLIVGRRDNVSNGATGTVYFSAGTFNVNNVDLGSISGNSTGEAKGTLSISGGVFTVNAGGSFKLATFSNTNTSGKATAIVEILGGALISNADIVEVGGTSSTTTNTTSTITLNGGTLDMTGHHIGSAANTINTLTLAAGTLKDTGEINGGAAISKTTTGTLVMQGNNAYTGATTVSGGSLLVNNTHTGTSSATGSNLVTVTNTTTLGGNGRIAGAVTVNSGGTLAPGGNATTITAGTTGLATDIGTMKIEGTLNVSGGASVAVQLKTGGAHGLNATFDPVTGVLTSVSGVSEDGGNDRLIVTGEITLDASSKLVVTLASGYIPTRGSVFDLLDWTQINGGTAIDASYYDFNGNGRRTGADNQASGLVLPDVTGYGSDYFWDVSQFGTTGVISVVPEPGRALLLAAGLAALLLRRRRAPRAGC